MTNKQAILKVLNELNDTAFERHGGEMPYILVEDREEVRLRLREVGFTDEQMDATGTKGEHVCLLALAFNNNLVDDYERGKFVIWETLVDDELRKRVHNGEGTSSDAERLLRALEDANDAHKVVFPRQPPEKQNGWSVSTEYINRVSEWIDANADANAPSMEDIENVLLAVESLKR